MKILKTILTTMRPHFLLLTPFCLILGLGTALYTQKNIDFSLFFWILFGSLSAHISVNTLNEYIDFKNGLDLQTPKTPFSGGSGALIKYPEAKNSILITGIFFLLFSTTTGVYLSLRQGIHLLPLGLLGITLVLSYPLWLVHRPILCLIAPGLGFGPVMVMGTHFVLTGSYSWSSFFASLIPFFLVNNLLLLNQFPDIEADKKHGRKNFPIVYGKTASSILLILFLFASYFILILGIKLDYLPHTTALGLFSLILGIPLCLGIFHNQENIPGLIPFMGINVLINLLTPGLIFTGLLMSS